MLSHKILTRQDVGDVATYYGDAADDYYAKEGEAQVWQGKGAEMLGLAGEVDPQRFRELLAGKADRDRPAARASTRDDSKTRIAIDLTFSAPKSVSIHALVGQDAEMIAAHDEAVSRVLRMVELQAQARQKIDGQSRVETTGNLIVAKFRHETTRALDPELHTHAVVINLTRRADGAWRALKNDEIIKMTSYLGVLYRSELASILEKQGHALRYGREGTFELASMSRGQVKAFSQRSAQIEDRLASLGLTRETSTSSQRQMAAMQTRPRKAPSIDREAMFEEWRARATELGIVFGRRQLGWVKSLESGFARADTVARARMARRAVQYAMKHLTEREAAITRVRLVETAVKHGVGWVGLDAINAAIRTEVADSRIVAEPPRCYAAGGLPLAARAQLDWVLDLVEGGQTEYDAKAQVDLAVLEGRLVPSEPRYTTPEAIARELAVLRIEREGRGALTPVLPLSDAERHLASLPLNTGQREAAAILLSAPHRVVGIEGFAGTGKSHMLRLVAAKIADEGYTMRALAPYGAQVKALKELGVDANTVAAFLVSKDQGLTAKTVLVIDEAGVVPARQMAQLLRAAELAGARVVLVGDRAQTKAIEAGRPFDQLIRAGMALASMTEIQRQLDPKLKEAVEFAARGDVVQSLAKMEHVTEIADDGGRRTAIAAAYVALSPMERDRTLIVSGTNEARREINANVREALGIAGGGRDVASLVRRDTTSEERRFAKNYDVGDTIQPERDYASVGLKRGELYTVEENGPRNRLRVRSPDGAIIEFSPQKHSQLSAYQTERSELARGDLVRVTRNDASLDVANGERFKVLLLTQRTVLLGDGKREILLQTDKPLHLEHAYATTVHSSQGLTAERTFIEALTKSRTTAKDVYYVAISRARREVQVFTDSHADLARAISRDSPKIAALDLLDAPRQVVELDKRPLAGRDFGIEKG